MVKLSMAGPSAAVLVIAMSFALWVNIDYTSQEAEIVPAHSSADSMSLIQGRLSIAHDSELADSSPQVKEAPHLSKDAQGTSSSSRTLHQAKADEIKPSDIVFTSPTVTQPTVVSLRRALHFATMQFAQRMDVEVKSAVTGLVVVMLVLVLSLVLCITCPIMSRSQPKNSASGQPPQDRATVLEQRERMLSHTSPVFSSMGPGGAGSPLSATFLPGTGGSLMPAPRDLGDGVTETPRISERGYRDSIGTKPPPLCPTLVMPQSEALLGIQMYELAQLSAEGELNVVGISGKALLRARVKKVGDARTLEIAMPEPNSIPRATICPSKVSAAVSGMQPGSRALEIRGMRGAFYGLLEMRSSGACYVVKDGQTVLTIDGDAESLQLSLKSSVGLQLASVRCSTELFNDVDHVEIRVEAGVDTVLVLSVVLAILLLSPYLPPVD